jgi:hypothetical protein
LLTKLDTVKTNGDFITVTAEIFRVVGKIRKVLEADGILHHATEPHNPLIATVQVPDSIPGATPIDAVKRLHANAELTMILHYTNRVLAILDETSRTIQNQIPVASSKPVALVDAPPIRLP